MTAARARGADRAETYLRVLAETELRHKSAASNWHLRAEWVMRAATTLVAAGAVDPEAAQRAVGDFEAAVALRSANYPAVIGAASSYPPLSAPRPAAGPGDPGTRTSAVPAGAALTLPPEGEGWYGELHLMGLVMTGSYAALTAAARWAGQTRRSASPRPAHTPFYPVGAIDDQGNSYRTSLWDAGIEDGREWWDCHLRLSDVPAAGTRWLEVGPGAGGAHVRINLTADPTPATVTVEPVPPASEAARLLDLAAEALLAAGRSASMTGVSARVAEVMRALAGGGAIHPADPAMGRLAALGHALGLDLGMRGTDHGPLPGAWASILAARSANDGPEGIASFAVTLPELDGTSFALAGLRSSRQRATLHVLACGWEPVGSGWLRFGERLHDPPPDPSMSWRARDSTGRWHLADGMTWGGGGMIQMHLIPPLHPAATSLEVIVTGRSGRIRATVPLDWQAAR